MAEPSRPRPVARILVLGLLVGALSAVAAAKPWFSAAVDHRRVPGATDDLTRIDMPLALALALVVLAGWGAALVSRGRLRTLIAGVALLASLGVVACVVAAPFQLPDDLRAKFSPGAGTVPVSVTGWFVTAAIAAVLTAVALGLAVARISAWPTMSSRYDAPAGRSATPDRPAEELGGTELWKALDEGRDPTRHPSP